MDTLVRGSFDGHRPALIDGPSNMTTDPDPRLSLLKLGTRSAVAGSALWTLAILVLSLELAEALLLVGPLIATPLGLPLCIPRGRHDPVAGRWRRVALLQPLDLALVRRGVGHKDRSFCQ